MAESEQTKNVVEFLMDQGADLGAQGHDGQTGLHWAAIFGQLETVTMLLARRAPLEVRNVHGGTVLGQTLWSAAHAGEPDRYIPILESLIAAGAKVPDRHPPVSQSVDELLERRGSLADESLWWPGEKPKRKT